MQLSPKVKSILKNTCLFIIVYFSVVSVVVLTSDMPYAQGHYYHEVKEDMDSLHKGDKIVSVGGETFQTTGGFVFACLKAYFSGRAYAEVIR